MFTLSIDVIFVCFSLFFLQCFLLYSCQVYAEFGVSRDDCFPSPGYYVGASSKVEKCPEGGYCAGKTAPAVPRPGFWSSSLSPNVFILCSPESACPGGAADLCSTGREGRMCAQCKEGYFKSGTDCVKCPRGATMIFIAFLAFSVLVVVLLVKFGAHQSAKAYSGTIGIATKFFQILAIIGRLQVHWPANVTKTISALTAPFSLRFNDLAPECTAPAIQYETKWAMTMLLPVFFALLFALTYVGNWISARVKRRPVPASLINRIINGYLKLVCLGYLTLASTAIEPFACRREKDHKYTLMVDPSKLCFEPWWDAMAPIAAIGIAVYAIGIPVLLMWWLKRNRHNLSDATFEERYGGLYATFVPHLAHWEAVVMLEKLLVAADRKSVV